MSEQWTQTDLEEITVIGNALGGIIVVELVTHHKTLAEKLGKYPVLRAAFRNSVGDALSIALLTSDEITTHTELFEERWDIAHQKPLDS